MKVDLQWITPKTDENIGYMARVSNVNAKPDDSSEKLITYLLSHKHFSPFEMACACVEIHTTRDIARQILRHRSFHFQEFSQRYAKVEEEPEISNQARMQDPKNRQNSIETESAEISDAWAWWQNRVWSFCWTAYTACLKVGIAKELARKLLPEGLTRTHMYMQGTIRDWLHYLAVRLEEGTQYEHRCIANEIRSVLNGHCPVTFSAAEHAGIIPVLGNDPGVHNRSGGDRRK